MAKATPGKASEGVSELAASVGLTDADLLAMYQVIATARAVDERMWILNRAGRIPFVISGQGHEGAQVGLAWPLRRKHDWVAPFYRSIATCLARNSSSRVQPFSYRIGSNGSFSTWNRSITAAVA
jgi:TPP-dependent pyruvate/acetoin dehydrogenase alpha subunit